VRLKILCYSFLLTLLFSNSLFAQLKPSDLNGSWVISKISYKDGTDLPDENTIKYMYLKYTFRRPESMNISWNYVDLGNSHKYIIRGGYLMIKTMVDVVVNSLKIESLDEAKLILLSPGNNGYEDPNSIRYEFVRESAVQNALLITKNDFSSIIGTDTIYKQSPKVYAQFNGEGFNNFVSSAMSNKFESDKVNKRLVTSFTVNKKGLADGLKILEGISPGYDELYTKTFNKARKIWSPATVNGHPVNVLMHQKIEYLSRDVIAAYSPARKANQAYADQDYETALYYYDQVLAINPKDMESLYKRGICKKHMGNQDGACNDWKKILEFGGTGTEILLEKYCK
jgi:hypothetical protein